VSSTIVIILIAIAVLVLALIGFLIIRRQRYVRALRKRGWTFESKPALEWVLDHHAPPIGIGFTRKVDETISGTTADGVPFRVFEYASSEGGRAIRRPAGEHAAAPIIPGSLHIRRRGAQRRRARGHRRRSALRGTRCRLCICARRCQPAYSAILTGS
jgi:hypothetical protein